MAKKGARSRTTTPGVSNGGRRRNRKHSAAEFLETPLPMASSPSQSPESDIFTGSKKRQTKKTVAAAAAAAASPASALFASPSHPPRTLGSISDLKDLASSRLGDLKRHIDHSHSEILKDLDASCSRLHKRVKIQNQECQKLSNETEKEYKKMCERIDKSQETMMTSYAEFMADVQASTSHACKSSIAKLSQSFEKRIDALRSRYGISSA